MSSSLFLKRGVLCAFFAGFLLHVPIQKVWAEGECSITKPQDILNCALNQHPSVIAAQADKYRDDKLVDIAKQRINPELASRVIGGESSGAASFNSEISLLHTIELGGERSSRMDQARALGKQTEIQIQKNKEEVALETVLALYRLTQIKTEFHRIDETVATFNKILDTFKSRPKLAPEQDISKSSFGLSREEYKLKKIALIQEQTKLLNSLQLATGASSQAILQHLPRSKNKWPNYIPEKSEQSSNADLELARSEKNLAKTNVALAKSKSWPDLRVGPSLDTEFQNGGGTNVLGGVAFSIPLPVLNRNRGEKAYAQAGQIRADKNMELVLQKTNAQKQLLFKQYKNAVQGLRSTHPIGQLASEHQNIESFFERGMVTSTLVIETHRQLFEITKTRNEQELNAVEALWRLYILDGRLMEEKI